MDFRVELEIYRGPVELLLYLVRRQELDVRGITLAEIVAQYLRHLEGLSTPDVDAVGDFVDITSRLIEIKAQQALPLQEAVTEEEPLEDPREGIVERLLEYKKYRDVASLLEERARRWQQTFPRMVDDLPPVISDPAAQPIKEVELWDLVSALGRIQRGNDAAPGANIVYDDVPIQTHMRRIHARIVAEERVGLLELLQGGMSKASVIGMFLAVLELVRHHCVEAEQEDPDGEIWVRSGENFPQTLELSQVDNYDGRSAP